MTNGEDGKVLLSATALRLGTMTLLGRGGESREGCCGIHGDVYTLVFPESIIRIRVCSMISSLLRSTRLCLEFLFSS